MLAFGALFWYWYVDWNPLLFCTFIVLSFLFSCLRIVFYQVSKRKGFYVRAGIRIFRKFVQDGDFVNNQQRKLSLSYKVINGNTYDRFLKKVMMYERFHLFLLMFFTLSSLLAVLNKNYVVAILIFTSNIIFNLYPVMLQQYNRMRIAKLLERKSRS